jgi:putative inorganic carbon (HCO3(-)) transporter
MNVASDTPRRRHAANAVLAGLLGVLLVLVPLPAGSHRPWAEETLVWSAYALVIVGVLLALLRGAQLRPLDRFQRASLLLWVLWLGWILLQWLPLPPAWLQLVAPRTVLAYARGSEFLGTPLAPSISIARDDTAWMLLLSSVYALIYTLTLLFVRTPRRRLFVVGCIIVSAIGQALFGTAMVATGLEIGPFGPKQFYLGSATGTFINRNHFAGYLELGGALAAGLILAQLPLRGNAPRRWRLWLRDAIDALFTRNLPLRIGLLVIIAGIVASQSRMGALAFLTTLTTGTVVFTMTRSGRGFARGLLLLIVVLVFDIGLVGSNFGLDELFARMAYLNVAGDMRLATFGDLARMIERYWLVGTGLGTFAYAYPQFRSPAVFAFNDHAHNDYAEFLIETGIPGVTVLGLLVLLCVWRGLAVILRRGNTDAVGIAIGGVLAVLSLALHSLTDFNLQIPANALTLVVILALLCGLSSRAVPVPATTTDADPARPQTRQRVRVRRRRTQKSA